MPALPPEYIIAIGASAGGMQEINSFFDHTPIDSVSYVIIPHLSAEHKSMMAGLLSRHSRLVVCEAKHGMEVKNNKVYVIPSRNFMTISDGRLMLTEKEKTNYPHLTINTFFTSLALEMGKKAIAVILSGTGSDGTQGMEAIKNAGGLVIASDPQMAEYKQMPSSAIDAGLVDYVLLPSEMPKLIVEYVKTKKTSPDDTDDAIPVVHGDDEKVRTQIIDFIKDHFPHDFTGYKHPTILRRIKRRALHQHINDLAGYLDFLKTNPAEVAALAQDFLISVTAFFSDKEAFTFLEKNIIPELIAQKPEGSELKIWVAGCATGEEAYSIAMLISEALDREHKNIPVKIFATDIDNIALSIAKTGWYDASITGPISPERLVKFFNRDKDGYRVNQDIRKMLIFSHHDLIKNPPYCNIDLVTCRNLLIYLKKDVQKKILAMLQFGIKKNGYLFLGSSENIFDKSPFIEEVHRKWKIYKVLEARRNVNFDIFTPPLLFEGRTQQTSAKPTELVGSNDGLKEYLNEAIISSLGITGVCVNEKNFVVQILGDVSRYFIPKMFNFSLQDIFPGPLWVAYSSGSRQALQSKSKVVVNGIGMSIGSASMVIDMTIIPLHIKKDDANFMLVLLKETENPSPDAPADTFDEARYAGKYILNLEEELRQTKGTLNDMFEKLDASNENMQSFNEELLSTNEEMQSTNEEMQSVNEELYTINAEYQLKIKELSDLNDDLNNYFRSNENGQVFINTQLLLMKFSPSAVAHFNLLDTDIGRPITNMSSNMHYETLEKDAKTVIANGSTITREVHATDGRWYNMMVMPYVREKNNKTDGAIITFNEITQLKKVQGRLDTINKSLTTVNADLENFVYLASHDLLGPLTNMEQIISLLTEKSNRFDQETYTHINLLESSLTKFKKLLRDLAVIGQIESEVAATNLVNIPELLEGIQLSIAETILLHKVNISQDLAIPVIRFSRKNLRSIVYNLISNAIKFRHPERELQVMITTYNEDNFTVLSVKDNGLGIAATELKNVFNMYKRIHQHIEGQGLGLYLVNKIVNASGGKVLVESELGKGATFKIYFKQS